MISENNIEIYSSRDKIREQLITYAQEIMQLENFDFNKTSFLSYFINTLSVLTADLIYYNSSAWKEFFLTKAQQRESVINLSAMLGYQPKFAVPSSVSVLLSMPLEFTSNYINIKLYGATDPSRNNSFKFYSRDATFSLLNNIMINITRIGSQYTAEIREFYQQGDITTSETSFSLIPWEITTSGTTQYLNFLVTASQVYEIYKEGIEFQIPTLKKYEFFSKDIDFKDSFVSDIQILTENTSVQEKLSTSNINKSTIPTIWTRYASIPLIHQEEYGYVLRQTSKGVRIYFGNGIYGKSPEAGDTCIINIHLTNGSRGNVIPGAITKSDTIDLLDGTQRRRITPQVVNSEPSINGEDAPTLDDIRSSAIAQVGTNKRLVTKYDYDNFGQVVEDIPVRTLMNVLKRSDLKRNEISLFTDLVYNDTVNNDSYIVPLRNTIWELDTTSDTTSGISHIYTIRNDDIITIDGEEYVSLFNIQIDPTTLDTRYFYSSDDLEVPVTITKSYSPNTVILPTYSNFYIQRAVNPEEDKSYFEVHYEIIDQTIDASKLICQVILPWSGLTYNLPHSVANKKFYLDFDDYVLLNDIPEGSQRLEFHFYYYDPTLTEINVSFVDSTITKTLDQFMSSYVVYLGETLYSIYDVPVILKRYYDNINKSKFNFYVLSKVIDFDVTKYRMLTDFCNLKFSNTTGTMTNMTLNPVTKNPVLLTNPSTLPDPPDGTRYAVCSDDNPWNREGGFVAIATSYNTSGWIFEELVVNDYFYVTRDDNKVLFNGSEFIEPIQTIPIQLEILVWVDIDCHGTDSFLVETIKNSLVNNMFKKFGYQKNILISEITRIVKSVDGVSNCKVLKPKHDIIFNYEVSDLTESQLMVFTPDLIYFDTNSITIILK